MIIEKVSVRGWSRNVDKWIRKETTFTQHTLRAMKCVEVCRNIILHEIKKNAIAADRRWKIENRVLYVTRIN